MFFQLFNITFAALFAFSYVNEDAEPGNDFFTLKQKWSPRQNQNKLESLHVEKVSS